MGRLGQQRDLIVVLDDPEPADERRAEREPGARQGCLEPQQVACRQVVRDGDARPSPEVAEPAASRTIPATISCGSPVSSQVTTGSVPAFRRRAQARGRRLEARGDERLDRRRPG
jgi:hypothetical protein